VNSSEQPRNPMADAGNLAAIRLGLRFVALFMGWLVSLVLGPERLGLLAVPNLLIVMAPFLSLGFSDALVRELPLARAQGEQQVRRLRDTAFTGALLVDLVLVLLLLFIRKLLPGAIADDTLLFGLTLGCFAFNALFKFFYCELTGFRRILRLGLAQSMLILTRAASVILLILALPQEWKLYGVYGGILISFLALNAWLYLGREPRIKLCFSASDMKLLLVRGFPISLASFFAMLMIVGDRLILSRQLGGAVLGYFEQSVLLREALLILPGVLLTVLIPDYAGKLNNPDGRRLLRAEVRRQNLSLALFAPPALGILLLHLPWSIEWLLPKFAAGIPLFQLTVLAVLPLFLSYIPTSFLITVGRTRYAALAAAAASMVLLGANILAGPGALETAWSTALRAGLVYLCYTLVMLLFIAWEIESAFVSRLKWICACLGGTVGLYALVWGWCLAAESADFSATGFLSGITPAGASGLSLVLIAAYAPLLYFYQKRTGRLAVLWKSLNRNRERESPDEE